MRLVLAGLMTLTAFALPQEASVKPAAVSVAQVIAADAAAAKRGFVEVSAMSLRIIGAPSARRIRKIEQFREDQSGRLLPSSNFSVVATVCNRMSWQQDFLVWTSIESVVAPAVRDFATGKIDPTGGVFSWGWMSELKDMRSNSVYSLSKDGCRVIEVGPFDLAPMMKSFDDPDDLWAWAIRVKLHVTTRDGNEVGVEQAVVRIEPKASRVRDASKQEMRVILGEEGGEPIPIVPKN